MKTLESRFKSTRILAILFLISLIFSCKNENPTINIDQQSEAVQIDTSTDILWHVKAFHPKAKLLDVKAIIDGHTYDVKAIQNSDQTSVMDVKAFVNDKILPVKIIVSEDKYMPVKAIDSDGTLIDIKAITEDGQILDVKGVSQSGNIVHIKAISKEGEFYNVEAISPRGWINDVKGIKMSQRPIEETINGVDVFAHIKSIQQSNL